jgi:hypothetical protein
MDHCPAIKLSFRDCSILVGSSTEGFNLILLRGIDVRALTLHATPLTSARPSLRIRRRSSNAVADLCRIHQPVTTTANLNGRGFCHPAFCIPKNYAALQGCTRRTPGRPLPGTSYPESVRMNRRDACSAALPTSQRADLRVYDRSIPNESRFRCDFIFTILRAEIWNPTREVAAMCRLREVPEWVLRHRRSTP